MHWLRRMVGKRVLYLGWRILPPRTRAGVSMLVAAGSDWIEKNEAAVNETIEREYGRHDAQAR